MRLIYVQHSLRVFLKPFFTITFDTVCNLVKKNEQKREKTTRENKTTRKNWIKVDDDRSEVAYINTTVSENNNLLRDIFIIWSLRNHIHSNTRGHFIFSYFSTEMSHYFLNCFNSCMKIVVCKYISMKIENSIKTCW